MKTADKIWIKLMDIFSRFWGCHQLPDRSFFIFGYQFPVCARCTGIIIGEITAIICLILDANLNILIDLLLTIPMLTDGFIQLKTKYISNNRRRLITGFLFGLGSIHALIKIIIFFKLLLV